MKKYPTATVKEVSKWLNDGIFWLDGSSVFKGDTELVQRINRRKGCRHGDPRIDLYHDGKRRSCNVSHIVWMVNTEVPIPKGFQIHHRDENCRNNEFDNLLCVHSKDHTKLHKRLDDVP